jgi:hypothetical protein
MAIRGLRAGKRPAQRRLDRGVELRAKLIIDQHTIQVWQGIRTVARVQPDEE